MRKKGQQRIFLSLLVSISFFMLTACTDVGEPEEITLYVQNTEHRFMQSFGIPYEVQHGNIKVVVMNEHYTGDAEPDIIVLPGISSIADMEEGTYAPLDPFFASETDIFEDLPLIKERMIEAARLQSEPYIYSIPMRVASNALFYNVDLFEEHDVPQPTNHMNWNEILALVRQFPTESSNGDELYGFTHNLFHIGQQNSVPLYYMLALNPMNINTNVLLSELFYADAENITMTANEENVIARWENMMEHIQSGHLNMDPPENRPAEAFFEGNAAMVVGNYNLAQNIESINQRFDSLSSSDVQSRNIPSQRLNWNMVTLPLDPDASETKGYYYGYNFYTIAEQSDQKEEAWEFIKYVFETSEFSEEIDGVSLDPFYLLEYDQGAHFPSHFSDISASLGTELMELADTKVADALENSITVREALEEIQLEGQQVIDQLMLGRE